MEQEIQRTTFQEIQRTDERAFPRASSPKLSGVVINVFELAPAAWKLDTWTSNNPLISLLLPVRGRPHHNYATHAPNIAGMFGGSNIYTGSNKSTDVESVKLELRSKW